MPTRSVPAWVVLLGVLCLLVGYPAARSFVLFGIRTKASEAPHDLSLIRTAELAYFKEHGTFVAAGPSPSEKPDPQKKQWAPEDGFRALGWKPEGTVYHQYEVRLTGPRGALLTARGDIDGDGRVAQYQLELIADGPRGEIKKLDEDVY